MTHTWESIEADALEAKAAQCEAAMFSIERTQGMFHDRNEPRATVEAARATYQTEAMNLRAQAEKLRRQPAAAADIAA